DSGFAVFINLYRETEEAARIDRGGNDPLLHITLKFSGEQTTGFPAQRCFQLTADYEFAIELTDTDIDALVWSFTNAKLQPQGNEERRARAGAGVNLHINMEVVHAGEGAQGADDVFCGVERWTKVERRLVEFWHGAAQRSVGCLDGEYLADAIDVDVEIVRSRCDLPGLVLNGRIEQDVDRLLRGIRIKAPRHVPLAAFG